ncbi:MAG TPA: Rho termination factor N-terminal domain-containing protein [Geobacteraceae bacterium]|nr:Rho termination factor N-terminal domain-containing protein [Geobacteraceae bacterium]
MNMQEIKSIAKEKGVKAGTMKKAELVQAIQQAEGNNACFNTGSSDSCGQSACLWKGDCD